MAAPKKHTKTHSVKGRAQVTKRPAAPKAAGPVNQANRDVLYFVLVFTLLCFVFLGMVIWRYSY